ncbi:MAG: hypothetical protein ACT4PT_01390 [Methanobacteriota archaeon]
MPAFALVSIAFADVSAEGSVGRFVVPSGTRNTLQFDTEGEPPLETLRFVFGGRQGLQVLEIFGQARDVHILFTPSASPSEATRHFAAAPVGSTASRSFLVFVENTAIEPQELTIGAHWR